GSTVIPEVCAAAQWRCAVVRRFGDDDIGRGGCLKIGRN
ncbi:hypothetical protein A2U01_0078687, partial [Trifolium medium]|nr:hypothetical protein [Trifolium medium]